MNTPHRARWTTYLNRDGTPNYRGCSGPMTPEQVYVLFCVFAANFNEGSVRRYNEAFA